MINYAYCCGVDWQHEMGHTKMELYDSIEALKADRECWKQCGIVRLRIELDEWVEEQVGWS